MKTIEQIKTGQFSPSLRVVFVGGPGEGKTYESATFPKCIFAVTCPGEEDTFTSCKELHQNITGWEYFIPTKDEDAPKVLNRLSLFIKETVKPAIDKKECETFVIDNVTFLAEYFWKRECTQNRSLYITKQGAFDSLKAFGGLKDSLRDFFLEEVLTLPCNIVLTVHLMVEDDETLEKKPDKTVPFNAAILGSFRDKLAGMVSHMIYLEKRYELDQKTGKSVFKYYGLTNKLYGKPAKSRMQIAPIIQNVSYELLKQEINKRFTT